MHSRHNKIASIKNLSNTYEIGEYFVSYYNSLLTTIFTDSDSPIPSNLQNLFPKIITDNDNLNLCRKPSPSDIERVIFSFASNKSPGPDGQAFGKFREWCIDQYRD